MASVVIRDIGHLDRHVQLARTRRMCEIGTARPIGKVRSRSGVRLKNRDERRGVLHDRAKNFPLTGLLGAAFLDAGEIAHDGVDARLHIGTR